MFDIAIDYAIDEEQKNDCEEYERMLDAKSRMIYDCEMNTFDFSKRRTTDLKNNSRVIFPKTRDFQFEAKLELLRIEAIEVFRQYMRDKCDERGTQKSNLSKSEARGLKSLKKRMKEGVLVVLPTDKTGNFAVMDRASYEDAGLSHVRGDLEVGWETLRTHQREINGHTSMLIKIFKIGEGWDHVSRVRETMMGEALEVCPVHLLYKDHKGWTRDKGGVPPTRHVAGGNRGMNFHISEIISDILEPMVGRVVGGCEIISTEDGLATFENMNEGLEGWNNTSWWEGKTIEKFVACGKCGSSVDYEWNEDIPDTCRCRDECSGKQNLEIEASNHVDRLDSMRTVEIEVTEDIICQDLEAMRLEGTYKLEVGIGVQGDSTAGGKQDSTEWSSLVYQKPAGRTYAKESSVGNSTKVSTVGTEVREGSTVDGRQDSNGWADLGTNNDGAKQNSTKSTIQEANGYIKCTHTFVQTLRRLRWEQSMEWDEDYDRILDSSEVLEEDLQDYTIPMVLIGADVISLYPNLDVDQVVLGIEEEVRRTDMVFSNVDYLEATRYLALNWSQEDCRNSCLRRVLPWRRKKTGTRPGITGQGPRNRVRGDQEQWCFPRVILKEWEKKQIIASVIRVATETMLKKHFYSFGGKTFHQKGGGPIGLRGTCAVARLIMQIFDWKWGKLLDELRVRIHGRIRYMDDFRTLLAPFRAGWRWNNGRISYCRRWEDQDKNLTPIERTKRVLMGTMGDIEGYLGFTAETEEDFIDGWLPTLDTALRVTDQNQVAFKFWEKPTNCNRTLHMRTAMGENQKIQILTQEMIRRMANTKEDTSKEDKVAILDSYCQKLFNSGYRVDQVRRIVVSGIKGWRGKVNRCLAEGKKIRRTAKDSLAKRIRTKLLGKSSWFKKTGNRNNREVGGTKSKGGRRSEEDQNVSLAPPRSVIFIEQTENGELATRLRELFVRLEKTVGFTIKVVERSGGSLQAMFPLNSLWDGSSCGRTNDCITCYQGMEEPPNCTKQSVLYENICAVCVPGAKGSKPVEDKDLDPFKAVLYVGESSRSIQERSKEHWEDVRGKKEDSHMIRHQIMEHGAANPPKFIMRVVGYHRSALSRQISEAVRIRRRGGAGGVLNSKAEYNRSHIPRLRVENEEEMKEREENLRKEQEQMEELLDREQDGWEKEKSKEKDEARRKIAKSLGRNYVAPGSKRKPGEGGSRSREKRRRYALLEENWGAPDPPVYRSTDIRYREGGGTPQEQGEPLKGEQLEGGRTNEEGGQYRRKGGEQVGTMVEEERREVGEQVASPSTNRELDGGEGNPCRDRFVTRDKALSQTKITLFMSGRVEERTDEIVLQDMMIRTELNNDDDLSTMTKYDDYDLPGMMSNEGVKIKEHIDDKVMTTPSSIATVQQSEESQCVDGGGGYESTSRELEGYEGTTRGPEVNRKVTQSTTPSMNTTDINKLGPSCSFERGVCTTHRVRGIKTGVTTSKKWRKLKNGFGWVTSKVNVYSCPRRNELTQLSPDQPTSNEPSLSLVVDIARDISTSDFGGIYFESDSLMTRLEQRSESGESQKIS